MGEDAEARAALLAAIVDNIVSGVCVQERPNTTVTIVVEYYWQVHYATGWAKVGSWNDPWDAEYGAWLALRKAVSKVARAIQEGQEPAVAGRPFDGEYARELLAKGSDWDKDPPWMAARREEAARKKAEERAAHEAREAEMRKIRLARQARRQGKREAAEAIAKAVAIGTEAAASAPGAE